MLPSKDISVVIQGAIDEKLTPKCLKSIRKFLPEAEIILSTWQGSDVSNLDYDILVLSQDPGGFKHDYTVLNSLSMNNFNRQLISTQKGLDKINRKYALKLRTDLELKNINFLNYWNSFSTRREEYKLFNHRVLCNCIYSRENSCQYGSGLPMPFHPSDFWFFGETGDIKNYFSNCPLLTEEECCNWSYKYPTRIPYSAALWRYAPEQNFCINWVKKYFPDLKFEDCSDWNKTNIDLSNNILYNNFIFLECEQSGIFSKKHLDAEKIKDTLLGLITYKKFQIRYKEYCDSNYIIKKTKKDYEIKLKKHLEKVVAPLLGIKIWIEEFFSVLYYLLVIIFTSLKLKKENDKH